MLNHKTIAFLATGSELLDGELLESNSHHSSKLIHQAGGTVKAKIIVSDDKHDITEQLLHLLESNDAVITIGGLGPTSDDITRFALAEATQLPLEFDENSWNQLCARLNRFGLKVSESNKQQALFPEHADILKNELGTANACHLKWNGRDIFMLPGPPREYLPLFEQKVMPYLKRAHYFSGKRMYHFLTLGLAEGEISSQVDRIAQKHQLATAYRWDYPYVDIKIIVEESVEPSTALAEIELLLKGHLVSKNRANAKDQLIQAAKQLTHPVWVKTTKEVQEILNEFHLNKIHVTTEDIIETLPTVYFELVWPEPEDMHQVVSLSFIGHHQSKTMYQHQMRTPKRETGIEDYIQNYFAWQLYQFLEWLKNG